MAIAAMAVTGLPSPASAQSLTPATVRERIASVRKSLNQLADRLGEIESRLQEATAAMQRHKRAITKSKTTQRRLRAAIGARAAALYKMGPSPSIEMLFVSEDVGDALDRLAYLDQVRSGERMLLEQTNTLRRRARIDSERLQRAVRREAGARAELEQRRRELAKKLDEYKMLQRFLDMAGSRRVYRPSRFGPRGFVCPVAGGAAVSNNFGQRRPGHIHQGVDMMAPHGRPVVAVLPGRIVDMPSGGGMGLAIIMRDLAGHEWYYFHLSTRNVRVGQRVVPGEIIGRVGCTGRCYGPHLHFEWHPGGGGARDPYGFVAPVC